ncbi:MAG: exo-alpha-sialidase [Bryobacteraceae bacterium]
MRHSFALAAALATVLHAAPGPRVVEHLVVYEQPGRFGGWPANNGLWAWGNEILVGFTAAHYLKQDIDKHQIDRSKPGVATFGRSRDGGKTWSLEQPAEFRAGAAAASDLREPLDFSSPGFAMTIRSGRPNSLLYHSSDRGHTWKGPYRFPLFGQPGIDARTDYLVNGRRDCLAFLTASKANGKEGRVICVRTRDGGLTWEMLSFIGPEPDGFSIMPSTLRLGPQSLLTAIRRKEKSGTWIEAYTSNDDGASWQFLNKPVPDTGAHSGNPPSLFRLKDGRLALTYGVRSEPYRICARLSPDHGRTWGDEIILHGNAAAWDLGYTRSVQRPDGKIVTVYYFMREALAERYIAATLWDPGR